MKKIALFLFLGLCLGFPLWAAQELPLDISADRLVYREKAGMLFLSGKVELKFKDYTLTGDKAWIDHKNRTGSFLGHVKLTSNDFTVSGEVLKVFYRENRLVFSGGVDFQSKKEFLLEKGDVPAPGSLTCDNLEYNWASLTGKAQGSVRGVTGNKRFSADSLLYQGAQKLLTLSGHARLERGDQEFLSGEEIFFDMKDQSATVSGGVKGSVLLQEKGFKLKPGPAPSPDDSKGESAK